MIATLKHITMKKLKFTWLSLAFLSMLLSTSMTAQYDDHYYDADEFNSYDYDDNDYYDEDFDDYDDYDSEFDDDYYTYYDEFDVNYATRMRRFSRVNRWAARGYYDPFFVNAWNDPYFVNNSFAFASFGNPYFGVSIGRPIWVRPFNRYNRWNRWNNRWSNWGNPYWGYTTTFVSNGWAGGAYASGCPGFIGNNTVIINNNRAGNNVGSVNGTYFGSRSFGNVVNPNRGDRNSIRNNSVRGDRRVALGSRAARSTTERASVGATRSNRSVRGTTSRSTNSRSAVTRSGNSRTDARSSTRSNRSNRSIRSSRTSRSNSSVRSNSSNRSNRSYNTGSSSRRNNRSSARSSSRKNNSSSFRSNSRSSSRSSGSSRSSRSSRRGGE